MLSFFPRGVLDEILNLIESVSKDFPSYSWVLIRSGLTALLASMIALRWVRRRADWRCGPGPGLGVTRAVPGCLESGQSWFGWWVSFALEFRWCYFCESWCLFCLSFGSDFCVSRLVHLWAGSLPRGPGRGWGEG